MWKVLTGVAVGVVVAMSAMQPHPSMSPETFGAPPSGESRLFYGRGDRRVAADLAWLAVVQRLGSSTYVSSGLPGLEEWIDVTTSLDPRYESAYFFAAAFLTALPERATKVDALLARGEAAIPESGMLPMARGFVHYFGVYEPEIAASHFRKAAQNGAPAYLRDFADRLMRLGTTCKSVGENLNALQHNLGASSTQAREAAFECSKRLIERGAAAERLRGRYNVTLDELREQGALQGLVTFPGECWRLESGKAWLEPCK
jgi:hypothetical protein